MLEFKRQKQYKYIVFYCFSCITCQQQFQMKLHFNNGGLFCRRYVLFPALRLYMYKTEFKHRKPFSYKRAHSMHYARYLLVYQFLFNIWIYIIQAIVRLGNKYGIQNLQAEIEEIKMMALDLITPAMKSIRGKIKRLLNIQ